MAFLSEEIRDLKGCIPDKDYEQMIHCFHCGKKASKGGMWMMYKDHIGICKECAPVLLDFYIDTMLDTGELDENDDIESVKKLSDDIIVRYQRKKHKKIVQNKPHI